MKLHLESMSKALSLFNEGLEILVEHLDLEHISDIQL